MNKKLLIFGLMFILLAFGVSAGTLKDGYTTGDDTDLNYFGINWASQTFTPSANFNATNITLKVYKYGTPDGIHVSIRATSSNKPTGSDLVISKRSGNSFPASGSSAWFNFTLNETIELQASTQYAIVFRAVNATGDGTTDSAGWRGDNSAASYAGGSRVDSSTSGSTWDAPSTIDFLFQVWEDIDILPTFKIYAFNYYGNIQIPNFNATINGTEYNASGGVAISNIQKRIGASINISITAPNFVSYTFENQSIENDNNYQLYPYIRLYAEDKYNGSKINIFTAELNGYKNFSTTNGSLKTDTALNINNFNITLKADKYFLNLSELTSANIAANGTYKFNMTPYTVIRAKAGVNNSFLNSFSITWNTSTGTATTNTTTTGNLYIPLYNNIYNVTIFNITDDQGYAIQTQRLIANPYLKSYNFSLYTTNSLNITFYDESTLTRLGENVSIDMNIYGLLLANYSGIHLSNYTYYIDVLTPDTYTIAYNGTGYYQNFYHTLVTQQSFSNLNLYMLPSTISTSQLRLRVKNAYTYQDYPNIIVNMQRLFPSIGSWVTVQSDISGEYGYTYFNIIELTTEYKFIFKDTAGNILKTSDSLKFGCSSGLCEITAFVSPAGTTTIETPTITYTHTLSNQSENGSVTWISTDGNNYLVNITILKPSINKYNKICTYEVNAASGTLPCNLTGYYGEIMVTIDVNGDRFGSFFERISVPKLAQNLDKQDQVFFTLGIFLTLVFIGLYSPIATIVLAIFALFVISVLGLMTAISISTIILGAIVGLLIAYKVRK